MLAAVPPSLSRTSSATSISSFGDPTVFDHDNPKIPRKRKRFTSGQLTILEGLFHRNSHPSREEREGVARAGGMEVKSVTIWFQNKRQTERRVALLNSSDAGRALVTTTSLVTASASTHSPTNSIASSRPSLDRVAARTELRTIIPRTPTRRRDYGGNLWDNMPSSPITSPVSPPPVEFVEMAKNQRVRRRTLEWACAAARLAEKEGPTSTSVTGPHSRVTRSRHQQQHHHRHRHQIHRTRRSKLDADLTEEDPDETITPVGSWVNDDDRWVARPDGAVQAAAPPPPKSSYEGHDDNVMRAALALCGLGRCS